MAIKLTSEQSRKVNQLVRNHCCNYGDGNCLLLDDGDTHVCVQTNSFSSVMCSYFTRCVLSNYAQLEAEIAQMQIVNVLRCGVCSSIESAEVLSELFRCAETPKRHQSKTAKKSYAMSGFRGVKSAWQFGVQTAKARD